MCVGMHPVTNINKKMIKRYLTYCIFIIYTFNPHSVKQPGLGSPSQ
jgi:hypothetical protein